ncbi:hypothetical protein KFE80_08495 [bacterium SCSIO 12696]|nr:hypothetical protein KFE80_08495 [bacterium SCSIO 12696]
MNSEVQRKVPGILLSLLLVVSLLALELPSGAYAQDAGGRLYRYRDAQGNVVISTNIPKEFAAQGYDILNNVGKLLQTVEPHVVMTEEQKAAKLRLQQQQVEDQYLLKSYSSVSEIEAARDRKLESLARDIALIESNLKSTRQQRNHEERKAADFQRGGRVVSEAVVRMLSELERRESDATQALVQRREESEREKQRYNAYITRYKQLTQ